MLALFLVCFSQGVFPGECYIKVENDAILPIEKGGASIKTKNAKFNDVLEKHGVTNYYQTFPTAPTDWLRGIYVLEGDMSIMEELNTAFAKEISLVEGLISNRI